MRGRFPYFKEQLLPNILLVNLKALVSTFGEEARFQVSLWQELSTRQSVDTPAVE